MGDTTKIEWADKTFNPWSGCTKVSPGCASCYAEKLGARFPHLGNWGPGAKRERTAKANWRKPIRWNREAAIGADAWDQDGPEDDPYPRPRVFCASLADWLDPEVPADWLADLLALIAATPELDWLLLTKRPQLWRERVTVAMAGCFDEEPFTLMESWLGGDPPPNVWVGTSVEDQQRANERIPELLKIPARVRFLSCEPLLGTVDLQRIPCGHLGHEDEERWLSLDALTGGVYEDRYPEWHSDQRNPGGKGARIHWVIAGGESGPGARPMNPGWVSSLRDQCQETGVAFFFKQWGAWAPRLLSVEDDDVEGAVHSWGDPRVPAWNPDGLEFYPASVRVGKKAAGRDLDGRIWEEVPRA